MAEIGSGVFWECVSLKSVAIPKGVTMIDVFAFSGCKSLKSVVIPKGVIEIGACAFSGCESLESITIPEGVTQIGTKAFKDCASLETVAIPGSVTVIGDEAFEGCESIHLNGSSLSSIGEGAFRGCKSIRINGSTPSSIDINAFVYILSLADMLPERIWVENLESLTPALKPAAVLAFAEDPSGSDQRRASHLKYIKSHIPLTVANPSLLDLAIRERLVTAENLPAYLEEARKAENTEAIAKLMEYAEAPLRSGAHRMEDFKTSNGVLTEYTGCDLNVAIPEGVTEIGEGAFKGYEPLESVAIPEGVTRIGDDAFSGCVNLKSVTIPEGVTKIGNRTFEN